MEPDNIDYVAKIQEEILKKFDHAKTAFDPVIVLSSIKKVIPITLEECDVAFRKLSDEIAAKVKKLLEEPKD